MKKIVVILFSVLFFGASCEINNQATTGRYIDSQRNIDSMRDGVVALVLAVDSNGQFMEDPYVNIPNTMGREHASYCSGFFIRENTILTAAHCVERTEIEEVEIPGLGVFEIERPSETPPLGDQKRIVTYSMFEDDEDEFKSYRIFRVIAFDREKDLAILSIDEGQPEDFRYQTLRVSRRNPSAGEIVYVMGHPVGLGWTLTEGIISREKVKLDNVLMIQTSADTFFGNSGGPMFDNDGRVIGVAHALFARQSHLALFIHPAEINPFIDLSL